MNEYVNSVFASLVAQTLKTAWSVGDPGSIPGLGRSLGEGMTTHSSILAWKIPWTDRAWQATIHAVAKSWTWLKWHSNHNSLHSVDQETNVSVCQVLIISTPSIHSAIGNILLYSEHYHLSQDLHKSLLWWYSSMTAFKVSGSVYIFI